MFEKASRLKIRFPYKGQCSVEDLWDLKVTELDKLYSILRAEQKMMDTESLLKERNTGAGLLALQIDIVKRIVEVKLAEKDAAEQRKINKMRKDKILDIIAAKQDAALEGKSVDELKTLLEQLD